MALTPQIQAPSAQTLAAVKAIVDSIYVPQATALAAYGIPAENMLASVAPVDVVFNQEARSIDVAQGLVLAVVRGRISDPKVRTWTYTLDQHEIYVIKLGNQGTIAYDAYTQQWSELGSGDGPVWRAYTGHNWLGGRKLGAALGSNIIVGDDGNGALYFLDPTGDSDDDARYGIDVQQPFLREVMGQIAMRGYDVKTCYSVSLMGSIGKNTDATLTAITLFTSDDDGASYDEHATINVDPGDVQARVDWDSGLGSFTAPGRLFLIQDRGALERIDWLDMSTDE